MKFKQLRPKKAYLHETAGQFGSNSGNSLLMVFSASVSDLPPASCSRAGVNFLLVGIGAAAAPKAPAVLEPKSEKAQYFLTQDTRAAQTSHPRLKQL